jgi:hypothetical protein
MITHSSAKKFAVHNYKFNLDLQSTVSLDSGGRFGHYCSQVRLTNCEVVLLLLIMPVPNSVICLSQNMVLI